MRIVLKFDMADTPQPASPKRNPSGANTPGKNTPCSAALMPNKSSKQDTYWFAHAGGVTPSKDAVDRGASPDVQADADTSARNHHLLNMSREERIRMVKERQEEERTRRLQEFQQHAQASQQYREQQEEERRKRIDELRQRDQDRRQQVEERKRLIWEAEHERKEAVLRRSMERDTKTEARRNANRMSASFAFGSSTPRTFDLDLATLGVSGSSILMSATNSRRSEERDFEASKKRAASSYNLCQAAEGSYEADSGPQRMAHFPDAAFVSPTTVGWLVGSGVTVGEDPMTRSMVTLQSTPNNSSNVRGRRKTDLTPVIPWNRGGTTPSRSRSPGTSSSTPGTAKRAVSMSRLDALAQPRRRFQHTDVSSATPPSMAAKSMLNLASHPSSKKGSSSTPKSMQQLVGGEPRLRQARSMCHLAMQPRQTRSSMLRTSKMSLSPAAAQGQSHHQSPSRPRSSMSMASEQSVQSSQASTVSLRPRPPQRKPRPLSIAGTIPDRTLSSRPTFGADKSGSSSPEKASRARSATSIPPEVPPKPAHLRKPQKPQPPASSPSRREQRTPPKSSRSQPNLASKAAALSSPGGEEQPAAVTPTAAELVVNNQFVESTVETAEQEHIQLQQKSRSPEKSVTVHLSQREEITSTGEAPQPNESAQRKEDSPVRGSNAPKGCAEEKGDTPTKVGTSALESVPVKDSSPAKECSTEVVLEEGTPSTKASRVISEEEARALLAEKRRLAREQAEREAELERQRQEELRRQEEERLRMEEEEQRRFEEEQIRLAEVFRKQEEEKLQRAIEEQARREAEEQQRKELEAQQKAEREEQERKAKEEAEKQRKELEERLRREEAERAERKKRVEEIMSRTRRRGGAKDSSNEAQKSSSPESDALASQESSATVTNGIASESITQLGSNKSEASLSTPSKMPSASVTEMKTSSNLDNNGSLNLTDATSVSNENVVGDSVPVTGANKIEGMGSVRDIEHEAVLAPTAEEQKGVPQDLAQHDASDRVIVSEQIMGVVDRSVGVDDGVQKDIVKSGTENGREIYAAVEEIVPMEQSPLSKPTSPAFGLEDVHHTNGYGHHGSPQDSVVNGVSSGKVTDLLDMGSLSSMVPQKTDPTDSSTADNHAVDNLINVDDINSNLVSGSPLIAFEEDNKNTKAQESPQLTDLLS